MKIYNFNYVLSSPDTADYKVYVTVWPPAVLHVDVWWDDFERTRAKVL